MDYIGIVYFPQSLLPTFSTFDLIINFIYFVYFNAIICGTRQKEQAS